jgi:hypothetical protein
VASSREVHWVAAESLEAALRYIRQRHVDFVITEARFLDMIPLRSNKPTMKSYPVEALDGV